MLVSIVVLVCALAAAVAADFSLNIFFVCNFDASIHVNMFGGSFVERTYV